MGMVNAPLHPCGARLAANWVPPGGVALANGLVTGAACVGMASTYVVFGWLIDLFDWPRAFLVSAGVTLAVAAVWSVLGADHPPGAAPPRGRAGPPPYAAGEFVALLANRSLLCLTGSYAALGYFQYLFFYWAQFYFEQERRLSKDESRLNSSLLTLAMAAGMVAGGWLSDWGVARLGTRRGLALVPVGGFLLGAVVTVVGALAEAPAVVLASFALAMAAVGSSEGAFWTTAVRLGGRHGGTAAGVLNCGGNAGGLVAPVLTPLLSELFGWKAGLMAAAVVCVAGAALWAGVTATEDAAAPGAYRKDLL
jgi:MFS family permease